MASMCIALLQMNPEGSDQQANLEKADAFCRRAARMGADVALMPEMWNIGYRGFEGKSKRAVAKWQAQAVARDGAWVGHFGALAKELGMAIGVAYLERWDGPPRNSLTLIDRHGRQVLTYAKVHTCDFGTAEASCTPGDGFPVCELDTAAGKVQVGAMICFDREQPESARVLMLNGAELILIPNACTICTNRRNQLQTRAMENLVAVAMTNYAAPEHNGHSVAFGPGGGLLVEAGEAEGVYFAWFDLETIHNSREGAIWADAYRRPHRYGAITRKGKKAPIFERTNRFDQPFRPEER
jgi:N-carbamoylputrescine amidase